MITYNGSALSIGGSWLDPPVDPYNPLGLPPFTMRMEFYADDVQGAAELAQIPTSWGGTMA